MRQRKIKNIEQKLEELNEFSVAEPKECKGRWSEIFGNDNPIYLELGCGKGNFILGQSKDKPNCNFIGVEGQSSVLLRAFEKARENGCDNVKLFCDFVNDVRDYFDDGELAGVFLNFSDPWPKARHAKRRLTYGQHLKQYMQIIKSGGFVEFKTDNDGLFEFTMEQIEEQNMTVVEISRDLHNSQFTAKNITTEYEDKFRGLGKNINYVRIRA